MQIEEAKKQGFPPEQARTVSGRGTPFFTIRDFKEAACTVRTSYVIKYVPAFSTVKEVKLSPGVNPLLTRKRFNGTAVPCADTSKIVPPVFTAERWVVV